MTQGLTPGIKVEICFANPQAAPAAMTWVNVTPYLLSDPAHPLTISRGRSTALDVTQPGRLTLTLNNRDGRFTANRAASPYYPNVKVNRAIRVTATLGNAGEPTISSPVFATYDATGITYDGLGWLYEQTTATASYPLFLGYVDAWPATWDAGILGEVRIDATDAFKLMSRRQLRAMNEDWILTSAHPTAYYPLSDQGTSLTVGNAANPVGKPAGAVKVDLLNATTTYPDPLGADGPYRDRTTALDLNSDPDSDAIHGHYLDLWASGSGPAIPWTNGTSGTLEFWFKSTAALNRKPGTWPLVSQVANFAAAPQHRSHFDLAVVGHGTYSRLAISNSHTTLVELPVGEVSDDRWHYLAAFFTAGSSTVAVRLFLDTQKVVTATLNRLDDAPIGVRFGDDANSLGAASNKFHGHLAGIAFHNPKLSETLPDGYPLPSARYLNGLWTWESQAPYWRLVTLALSAMPTLVVGGELGNNLLAVQATDGQTLLDACQEVAATESGTVHISGAGTLTLNGRHHQRYRTPDLAVDAAVDGIAADFTVGVSDEQILNLLTVTRRSGASMTVANAASQTDYGQAADSATTLHLTDEEMTDWANYRLNRYAQPAIRTPTISVDPYTSPTLWAVSLGVDVGHLLRVANLPSTAPATTADLVIESIRHEFTAASWQTTLETSPADTRPVAVFGRSTFGHCVFGF